MSRWRVLSLRGATGDEAISRRLTDQGKECFAWLLRNKPLGSDRLGEEREAQSRRGALEVTNSPLTEVVFIELLTLRLIGSAMFEHMIEHTRQLMGGGGDRLRGAFAGPQPAVITAQGRLRAPQRLRRQAPRLRRAAVAFERVAAQHQLPPEMSLCGANPSQEAKCFSVGHLLRSVPIADTSPWALLASKPSVAVRSTPSIRYKHARTSNARAFLAWEVGLGSGPSGGGGVCAS